MNVIAKNRKRSRVDYIRINLKKYILRDIDRKQLYRESNSKISLGCSLEYFKRFLESRFTGLMNWENYGALWNLHHIKSISSFDYSDARSFREVNHYTNLTPILISKHKEIHESDRRAG
tara:strand:+ start:63603 stop:63959 length:357 start_codon:yes stop_codon:yes gene_type:complete